MRAHFGRSWLLPVLLVVGISFSFGASTFLEDWNYYQKTVRQRNLTPNDRLFILYRLLEKYQNNSNYTAKLKKEINLWENEQKNKNNKISPPVKVSQKDSPAAPVLITKVFAADTPDFSQAAIFAPNLEKYNYFLLTDPDPTAPPKIVIDLYNSVLAIPEKERTLTPETGEISEIRLGQFETYPNKTVRAVVTVFSKKPYQIVRDKQYLLLLVYKNPATPIPSAEEVAASFKPAEVPAAPAKVSSPDSSQSVSERKISLLGEVRNPGYYEWKENLKLVELVSSAGGFNEDANITKINLVRKQNNQTQSSNINLQNILNGREPDIALNPGDTIYVPKKPLAGTNEFISTIFPWLSLIAVVLVIRTGLH